MRLQLRMVSVMCGAVMAVSTSAQAATTILTFDAATDPNPQPACAPLGGNSGPATILCAVETFKLGNDYGSTPELAITYNRTILDGRTATGTLESPELVFLIADGNGVGSSFGDVDRKGTIIFTPTAGHEVSFAGFDFIDRNSALDSAQFTLTDSGGVVLFDFTSLVLRTRTSYVANTGYFSGPLTLTFDGLGNRSPSVDNIVLNTRLTPISPPVGGVPEPASWALMIGGFGMVGGAMRRRRELPAVAA